jgi:hypothetical protein
LVENKFGLEMVDIVIPQSTLELQGLYISIGTYIFYEMLELLQDLNMGIA